MVHVAQLVKAVLGLKYESRVGFTFLSFLTIFINAVVL